MSVPGKQPKYQVSPGELSGSLDIPYPEDGVVLLQYVFPNQTRYHIQSKTRIANFEPKTASECPLLMFTIYNNFEGLEPRPEMILKPVALFRDPFRRGPHKIVLAEVWETMDKPCMINTRHSCTKVMEKIKDLEPWFGIEQEYMIVDQSGHPSGYKPIPGGTLRDVHSLVGHSPTAGIEREITEHHLKACLYAGIKMYGNIREDCISQWEYQVGPCEGVDIGDHLHVSRYLLVRVAEMYGLEISFETRPVKGATHVGSGGHLNFSTKEMREENGIVKIRETLDKLTLSRHDPLLVMYDPRFGKDIEERMKGTMYCPGPEFKVDSTFKQNCSLRIPTFVLNEGKGYFEDRRPPSNIDPYTATEGLVRAAIFGEFMP